MTKGDMKPLPDYLIPNKYLINTYLLNPIRGKDGIPYSIGLPITIHFSGTGVGAYRIRPPNAPVWGRMIGKPGMCWGVCDTPLPIRDKNLINTYLLNPMFGKDGIPYSTGPPITTHFLGTGVGAYRIRPSAYQAHSVVRPLRGRLGGVFDTPLRRHLKNRKVLGEHFLIIGR